MKFPLHCRFLSAASFAFLLSCTGDSPTGTGRKPAQIQVVSGSNQKASAGTPLAEPLVVRVTDAGGRAVRGAHVEWNASEGGGTLSPASGVTDDAGEARASWTLGTTAGSLSASAAVQGISPVLFSAVAGADAPASLKVTAGDGQDAIVGTALRSLPMIRVADRYGNPVPGVEVAWAVTAGGGTVTPSKSGTDMSGSASVEWTVGTTTGMQTLTASVTGVGSATFTATASPPPAAAKIEKVQGDSQTGVVGEALADSLAVRVVSADGKPVPWAVVSWSALGGALSSASRTTDRDGIAKVRWTLGGAAGVQGAEARVSGVAGSPVAFRATGNAGTVGSIKKVSGDEQRGTVGLNLLNPLRVQVSDRYGNPIGGARVTWAPSGGGSITPDNNGATYSGYLVGEATASWKLGPNEGRQVATATVGDVTIEFTATAGPWVPVASVSVQPSELRLAVGRTFHAAAIMQDAAGNELGGRPVTWSTSAPEVASVSSSGPQTGQITPLAPGKAVITATSEGKSGSTTLTVLAAPGLTGFSRTPPSVDVTSASAPVEFTVSATDTGPGLSVVRVGIWAPSGRQISSCEATSPVSGSRNDGVWKCAATIPRGANPGTYRVESVALANYAGSAVYYNSIQLAAAGYSPGIIVNNSGPLATQPVLTGLSFSPATVDITSADGTVEFTASASASAGVRIMALGVSMTRGNTSYGIGCGNPTLVGGTAVSGTWKCSLKVGRTAYTGTYQIGATIEDAAGNVRDYDGEDIRNAGFPSTLQVTRVGSSPAPSGSRGATRPRE